MVTVLLFIIRWERFRGFKVVIREYLSIFTKMRGLLFGIMWKPILEIPAEQDNFKFNIL